MSDDNVLILTDELRSINSSIEILISKIKDNLTTIKTNVDDLKTKDIWIGKSADNYQDKFAALYENYEKLYSELKNGVNYIYNVCQIYENVGSQIDLIIGEK